MSIVCGRDWFAPYPCYGSDGVGDSPVGAAPKCGDVATPPSGLPPRLGGDLGGPDGLVRVAMARPKARLKTASADCASSCFHLSKTQSTASIPSFTCSSSTNGVSPVTTAPACAWAIAASWMSFSIVLQESLSFLHKSLLHLVLVCFPLGTSRG